MEQTGRWLRVNVKRGRVAIGDIPVLDYSEFYHSFGQLMRMPECHCVNWFAYPEGVALRFIAMMADDRTGEVLIASHIYDFSEVLSSLAAEFSGLSRLEREITENYGVRFEGSNWHKPVRFAHDRADRSKTINNYPFYSIEGDSLHEVNVGPIHAGIIEPGVFRFICNGEEIIHIEIVLGFQHRGIESLMRATENRLRQVVIAESVAGDSAVAHAVGYCRVLEALGDDMDRLAFSTTHVGKHRVIALEMERIAMHIADTSALCQDIGYQLGQVACEALRTIIINTMQCWCGNRFGKGLIRPWGSNFAIDDTLRELMLGNLRDVLKRYRKIAENLHNTPSVLSRFEDCGVLHLRQAASIGVVGMAARASGLERDIRLTHPCGVYEELSHIPVTYADGDVMARLNVRIDEVAQSAGYIEALLGVMDTGAGAVVPKPVYSKALGPSSLAFSLVEGWRGEICHVAVTDDKGEIAHYKIKDPSLNNWLALALSVRGSGISDFPICNKSFNLSYAGHDL